MLQNLMIVLVGENVGEVIECSAAGEVVGEGDRIGGLVGENDRDGSITDSFAEGKTRGEISVGGLVGYNQGSIVRCYSAGDVLSEMRNIGGLTGFNHRDIPCKNHSIKL